MAKECGDALGMHMCHYNSFNVWTEIDRQQQVVENWQFMLRYGSSVKLITFAVNEIGLSMHLYQRVGRLST